MRTFLFALLCMVPLVTGSSNKLLVILVDGCRYNYVDDPTLKGFKKLADNGVHVKGTEPIFPTNSYPNWLALMTGLYAESHGFVNNMMYDSYYNDFFLMAPNETANVPHWWNDAEPLWITAEKNGKKSALYWWDGCQVEIHGTKPSFCKPYKYVGYTWPDVNRDMEEAIKTSLDLLENDEIQLAQIYYEPVDFYGHKFGPDSEERKSALRNIDNILDDLQTQMVAKGLHDKVNLVIFSDHGMIATDSSNLNVINLNNIVDVADIKYMIYYGAGSMILPEDGRLETLYSLLRKVPGMSVYKKEEIPERYHLKNNRHTQPLLLVAHRNYYIKGLDIPGKSIPTGSSISPGSHGFDLEDVPEMKGIFFARGPNFKEGVEVASIKNVDVYNMLCECLGIQPRPNNGSRLQVMPMLRTVSSVSSNHPNSIMILAFMLSGFLCLSTIKSFYL